MSRLAALIAVLLTLAALPAVAVAQENPFLPEQQQQPSLPEGPPPPAPVEERDDGDGMSGGVVLGIVVSVLVLVGGIWWGITRDARRAAPERSRPHTARSEPNADDRMTPGARGRHHTRASGSSRKQMSRKERERRKRGRAR